jgi:hypothetical protein
MDTGTITLARQELLALSPVSSRANLVLLPLGKKKKVRVTTSI